MEMRNFEFKMDSDLKEKILSNFPIFVYIILLIFTLFFEMCKVKFDIALIISSGFWLSLSLKYVTLVLVYAVMYPYFVSKFKESSTSKEIQAKAVDIGEKITARRLSLEYKKYTKEIMNEEEHKYFLDLFKACGNLDPKYMSNEISLLSCKADFDHNKINKVQYKLIRKFKLGKIKFHKLKGDEIKYVSGNNVTRNKKYANQHNSILKHQATVKIVSLFIFSILFELIMESASNSGVMFKDSIEGAILSCLTLIMDYATSTWFAYSVAVKIVTEWQRFLEVITIFTANFLEQVDSKQWKIENSEE